MNRLLYVPLSLLLFASCTVTIPMQTNLSEQTLLFAQNRNIKVNYELISEVPDGYMRFVNISKNGTQTTNNSAFRYSGATAFKQMWTSYFTNKFNSFSKEEMDVRVVMKRLELQQNTTTSTGMTLLTGNAKMNVAALAEMYVKVFYEGETYEKVIQANASDYNESQTVSSGGFTYYTNAVNPTQQKSKLLESCLNRSVIEFENFIKSIMQH